MADGARCSSTTSAISRRAKLLRFLQDRSSSNGRIHPCMLLAEEAVVSRGVPRACAFGLLSAAACASTTEVVPFPVTDDVKVGRSYAADIDKSAAVEKDPDVNSGIERIGRKIVNQANTDGDFEFVFKVIHDDQVVNAFALPGGKIYVYSGLVGLAEDEAEMAGVLAHEIAHVTERHSAKRMTDRLGNDVMEQVIRGDAGIIGGTASRVTTQGFFAYTRRMEVDADEVGLRFLEKTSYDPYGMPRFFDRIAALDRAGSKSVRWFTSDHPDPGDRAASARHDIAELPSWLQTGETNREAWLAYRERVIPKLENQ
jgi:predicted Zn-dependent protease